MKLYEYDAELELILDNLDDDPSDEVLAEIESLMNRRQETRDHWMESLAMAYRNANIEAEAIKTEKMRLQKSQTASENRAERIKTFLAHLMDTEGVDKLTTPRGVKLSWRTSKAVEVDDMDELPPEFWVYAQPRPDKTALADVLKTGVTVPGARMVERRNVQIR